MNADRRVVITGLGLVTPLGEDRESSWKFLIDGKSGVTPDGARASLAVPMERRGLALAEKAAREALSDGGFSLGPLGSRWGCLVSSSKPLLSESLNAYLEPDGVPSFLSERFGISGPVINVSSACATGLQSAMIGAEWIREGRCDFVLAGAAESSFHPLYIAGFSQMGVLSKKGIVRPFDRKRDGFVMGEGAGVFLLENAASAFRRGAKVYGEMRGWDFSCDAHHAARFNSNGGRMAGSFRRALGRAGVSPEDVGYVNAHGTGTLLNDALETNALLAALEGHPRPRVSSTKGATGHMLGATGAVELAFSLLALRDNRLPPTLNLENPETDKIDFIPHKSLSAEIRTAASLSFGFGGALASVIVGKT